MGKVTGFMEFDRNQAPYRDAGKRLLDFQEIYTDHDEARQTPGLQISASVALRPEAHDAQPATLAVEQTSTRNARPRRMQELLVHLEERHPEGQHPPDDQLHEEHHEARGGQQQKQLA